MKIDFYHIKLPLNPPLMLMGRLHSIRSGLLIRLADQGRIGYGEANPLPGLHKETIEEVLQQLTALLKRVPGWTIPLSLNEIDTLLKDVEQDKPLLPSLRFALESALLQLAASHYNTLPPNILNPSAASEIEINGLLAGEGGKEAAVLQQMLKAGCKTIKVKVGRHEIDEEIALVKKLSSLLPVNAQLRLDANQAWEMAEARRFMDGVGECAVEYLEEPLKNPADLHLFTDITPVPLALDESMVSASPKDFDVPANVAAFILKPAVLGGAVTVSQWADLAHANDADVVISGSFCSSVGLIAEAGIAAAFSRSAVGLGTWRWLAEDVLNDRFAPKEYHISAKDAFAKLHSISGRHFSAQ